MAFRQTAKAAIAAGIRRVSACMTNGGRISRRLMVILCENLETRRRVRHGDVRFTLRVTSGIEAYRADTLAEKEPETLEWLRGTLDKDSLLLDVGANIGLYSLYAAALPNLGVQAVAFEPAGVNFANLCRNIVDNGFAGRIAPVAVALGSDDRITELGLADLVPGSALHGDEWVAEGSESLKQFCQVATLDRALRDQAPARPPTHMKIDVDGPEIEVLRGAEQTLRQESLRHLLVELSEDAEPAGTDLIVKAGFTLERRSELRGNSRNFIFVKPQTA